MVWGLVRFTSVALLNEVERTGTITELSVRRRKRGKVERGVDLMEGGTHSELMNSNIFAMKLMR